MVDDDDGDGDKGSTHIDVVRGATHGGVHV